MRWGSDGRGHQAPDIEMLINTSITRSRGEASQSFEPPLSLYVKQAIGAAQAVNSTYRTPAPAC